MRILLGRRLMFGFAWLFLLVLGIYGTGRADDGKPDAVTAAKASARSENPVPLAGLTERERWLLDRVEQLEKRVAELESKTEAASSPSAKPSHPRVRWRPQ